jgi:predicted membrane-bound dolichyl-phosphate-mannose-protein mannosyltransferase
LDSVHGREDRARSLFHKVAERQRYWLAAIAAVILATHVAIITTPGRPLFDEQHYVTDARAIIAGAGSSRLEHPPLGKLFIVSGILLCGDNPVGWRVLSVIFGTLSLLLFHLICRHLMSSKIAVFLATFLLAFENLSFIQASVAMLDVFCLTFMLLAFLLYLKGRYLCASISVALSALTKLNGALALPAILLHWIFSGRKDSARFGASLVTAPAAFISLMPALDFLVFHKFLNPINRIKTMLDLSASLTFATADHPALSRPWEWVLRPIVMPYWYEPHYLGAISFTLWGLIIPSTVYLIFKAKQGDNASLFGISWFASTYLVWLPISVITDRISFVYYFYPAVGPICIGAGLGFQQLLTTATERGGKLKKVALPAVATYLVLHIAVFVILSPLSTWWSIASFA